MASRVPALVLGWILVPASLLAGCGPAGLDDVGPDADGDDETEGSGELDEVAPARVAEYAPDGCRGAAAALASPAGGALVVGEAAVISGWIARFDASLALTWEAEAERVYADLDLAADGSVWVAAGGWGQAPGIDRYDLGGQALAGPPDLALPDDVELRALARVDDGWLVGGRRADALPFDAWLAALDEHGASTAIVPGPSGDGNVSAQISAIEAAPGLAGVCGVAPSGGEWGRPWGLLVSTALPALVERLGELPSLGVRACADVAVREDRVAWAEGPNPELVVVTDAAGAERWQAEELEPVRALAFARDGALILASDAHLWARDRDGALLWSLALAVPDLHVEDLAVLVDGGILIAGATPGSVGECRRVWLGLYR